MSQIFGNGFIPSDGLNGTAAPWALPNAGSSGTFPAGSPAYAGYGSASTDAVRPAWFASNNDPAPLTDPGANSGISGILAQLASQVQQSIAKLSNALMGTPTASTPTTTGAPQSASSGAATFANVSLGSTGDPHLSFNGQHWNDMQSQANLIDSNSFDGGFNVSTQTTAPNSRGVTYNQSAAVTTDYGSTQVTLDNKGNAVVTENGQQIALGDGQSLSLGNGESVARANDGDVTITDTNQWGGSINTTLSDGGRGVNVSVQANNVDLGGSLVNGPGAQTQPAPFAPSPSPPIAPAPPQPQPVVPGEPWRRYAEPDGVPN